MPIDAEFLHAAGGKVFLHATYLGVSAYSAYILDESDVSKPLIATASDPANPSAEFYPGNLITIIGAKLGPEQEVRFPFDSAGLASTVVDGLRVLVDRKECAILSASSDRIVALLPLQLPSTPSGVITVEQNGVPIASMPFRYGGRGFAILAGPYAPLGLGFENEDGSMNSESNPAPVGSVVKFHIVAVGTTNPQQIEREINHSVLPRPSKDIDVLFGYSGLPQELASLHQSEQFVTGIFEVRVRVGSSVTADHVPVVLRMDGYPFPQWRTPVLYVRH